eukprot:COSAG04_NODE_2111_length_4765_cov_91.841406_7_plen_53_part_01
MDSRLAATTLEPSEATSRADAAAPAVGFSWALAEVGERVGLNPRYTVAFGRAA